MAVIFVYVLHLYLCMCVFCICVKMQNWIDVKNRCRLLVMITLEMTVRMITSSVTYKNWFMLQLNIVATTLYFFKKLTMLNPHKNRAWSPPSLPSPPSLLLLLLLCHVFYINFYINWSNTFFSLTSREVLYMTVFWHKCSNRIHRELFKWSEIWHEHRPIYGTDYWLRKFGGPWQKKGFIGVRKVVFDSRRQFFAFFSIKEST